MEKQTAVEWLCNEWLYIDQEFDLMLIDKNIYWKKLRAAQEQAKAMEKEQMIKAYKKGKKHKKPIKDSNPITKFKSE